MTKFVSFFLVFIIFIFTGCAPKYEKLPNSAASFQKQNWDDLEGFENDNHEEALNTFIKSCEKSGKKESLKSVCEKAKISKNPKDFFISNFTPYKIVKKDGNDTGLITGYYEPLLKGSKTKSDIYKYPVLKTPKDLLVVNLSSLYPELSKFKLRGMQKENSIVPYLSREQIEQKIDEFEPICYVDNKIDLFFLQIQGSGKIALDNGEMINVGYDNQNGHPYYSIGKRLLEDPVWASGGVSMQKIKEWATANDEFTVNNLLNQNSSYIFFAQRNFGATGSLGVELVPKRHIAVDTSFTPLGYPVFLNTSYPATGEKIQKIMVAGDTGGAIKGEIRADLFYGFGNEAGEIAGKMKQSGQMILFVPNEISKIKGK